MLKQLVNLNHYKFVEEVSDWKEAIRLSCEPLEKDGTIEANYKEDIINCIEKYGPYMVIMPMVAIPHSQEFAEGVNKTSISFMKLNKPVSFDINDKEKDVQIFFTLASCNSEQHLVNMQKLSELLINEELLEELKKVTNVKELLQLQTKYLN